MPTLKLWTFAKRQNSTAQPPDAQAVSRTVDLKAAVSMLQPVFLLSEASTPTWNYCQFEGRYYHITDITSVRKGLWEISASVDVLATYKANILASSAFVAYDASANTELPDTRLSAKATPTYSMSTGSFSWLTTQSFTGTVVVGITGHEGVCYYLMTPAQADYLLTTVENWLDTVDLDIPEVGSIFDIPEAVEALCVKITAMARQFIATGKASDNIRSAAWFPFPSSVFPTSSRGVYLGEYYTGYEQPALTQCSMTDGAVVSIPWQASDWRRCAPYHEIILELPYLGTISVSPSSVAACSSIQISAGVDTRTGEGVYSVKAGNNGIFGVELGQYTFNCAGSYAIGSSNVTPMQALTALGMGAGAVAAAALAPSAAVAAVAGSGGIMGMISHLSAQTTAISSGSGAAGSRIAAAPTCTTIFHDTNVTPDSVSGIIGTPTMAVKQIPSSGYVETRCMSVSGSMSETERQEINSLMNGGVYIE